MTSSTTPSIIQHCRSRGSQKFICGYIGVRRAVYDIFFSGNRTESLSCCTDAMRHAALSFPFLLMSQVVALDFQCGSNCFGRVTPFCANSFRVQVDFEPLTIVKSLFSVRLFRTGGAHD